VPVFPQALLKRFFGTFALCEKSNAARPIVGIGLELGGDCAPTPATANGTLAPTARLFV
jgi:hypothetical protein